MSLETGSTLDDVIDRLELGQGLTMLCLDIDGNDYWVLKSLVRHTPSVICCEYNAYCDPLSQLTVPYDPDHRYSGGFYYGASAGAFYYLLKERGYELVGYEPGLDLFFVKKELLANTALTAVPLEAVPRGRKYNWFRRSKGRSIKEMVPVDQP